MTNWATAQVALPTPEERAFQKSAILTGLEVSGYQITRHENLVLYDVWGRFNKDERLHRIMFGMPEPTEEKIAALLEAFRGPVPANNSLVPIHLRRCFDTSAEYLEMLKEVGWEKGRRL